MLVEKDIPIKVSDGATLRANFYRPDEPGRYPVLLAMGIYGKDVHFADGYALPWEKLMRLNPNIIDEGSSGRYLRWEMIDPERWVPDGYVVVAVDSRGSGKSPGYLDPFSPRETQDYHDAIEWAAAQPWSTGKVGLIGISYLSIKQWQVAALRPPHLAAICPWEGGNDHYRDWSHHGGILSNVFPTAWWPRQVLPNQNGNSETTHRDRDTGAATTGEPLSPDILAGNRTTHPDDLAAHPLDDAWYRQRTPDLSQIEAPLLSAGNWGGAGLHLRGNIEGYLGAGSAHKWLEMHVGTHFESFYLPRYIERQKRFFACFLKGEENGWRAEPPIRLEIRWPDAVTVRSETEWPLERTHWTRFYLDARSNTLSTDAPSDTASHTYAAMADGVDFMTAPFEQDTEFTGPLMARLFVSSETADLDIFATLRMFDPEGKEVAFEGASDIAPVARGWLRASHRKLDPVKSIDYRPFHSHDSREMLTPGGVYPIDVEIWPTSIVYPAGYRMALNLRGCDFEALDVPGRILHTHLDDRPPAIFGGRNSIHTGPGVESYLLLPLIPSQDER